MLTRSLGAMCRGSAEHVAREDGEGRGGGGGVTHETGDVNS